MEQANIIVGFRGEHRFLSNFYPCKVTFYRMGFSSVEAAFQAAKCADHSVIPRFLELNPTEAKHLGRRVKLRPDWDRRKLTIMENLLVCKFEENPELRDKLICTGTARLIESNTWHDNFWGDCTCPRGSKIFGQNQLGRILMRIRTDYVVSARHH